MLLRLRRNQMKGRTKSTTYPDRWGLLLASPMPVGMDSSNRNDWLVDIPLPEEEGFCLSLSGIAPQPDSSSGLRRVSLLLTENMPLEPICSFKHSILTVLLLKGVPSHLRGGQNDVLSLYKRVHSHPQTEGMGLPGHNG